MKTSDITDKMVVEAAIEFQKDRSDFITDILQKKTGAPIKIVIAAMERADHRGLIDYGVSLRTAWPTDKGLSIL